MAWTSEFSEREQKEIALSRVYAADYAHGTDGHNAKMIIAKLASMLDRAEKALESLLVDTSSGSGRDMESSTQGVGEVGGEA